MIRISRIWLTASALLIGGAPTASAQWNVTRSVPSGGELGAERASRSDAPRAASILSLPCDPLMSVRQEEELFRRLEQPCPFSWDSQTTLGQLSEDVATVLPVVLDRKSLEEIGLDPELELGPGAPLSPLSDSIDTDRESVSAGRGMIEPAESDRKWWRSEYETAEKRKSAVSFRPSLITAMTSRLDGNDLTLMVTGATLKITTRECAEDKPALRLYDVGTLLQPIAKPDRRSDPWLRRPAQRVTDVDALTDMIQTTVNPDIWERLGGNSSMTPTELRGRQWLVVKTTTMTHLKVQRLLDRLNQ